jgi:hypothetical protein
MTDWQGYHLHWIHWYASSNQSLQRVKGIYDDIRSIKDSEW